MNDNGARTFMLLVLLAAVGVATISFAASTVAGSGWVSALLSVAAGTAGTAGTAAIFAGVALLAGGAR